MDGDQIRTELLDEHQSCATRQRKNLNDAYAGCMITQAHCFDLTKHDSDINDPYHRILLEATYEDTIDMFGAVERNTSSDCQNFLRANRYSSGTRLHMPFRS